MKNNIKLEVPIASLPELILKLPVCWHAMYGCLTLLSQATMCDPQIKLVFGCMLNTLTIKVESVADDQGTHRDLFELLHEKSTLPRIVKYDVGAVYRDTRLNLRAYMKWLAYYVSQGYQGSFRVYNTHPDEGGIELNFSVDFSKNSTPQIFMEWDDNRKEDAIELKIACLAHGAEELAQIV